MPRLVYKGYQGPWHPYLYLGIQNLIVKQNGQPLPKYLLEFHMDI